MIFVCYTANAHVQVLRFLFQYAEARIEDKITLIMPRNLDFTHLDTLTHLDTPYQYSLAHTIRKKKLEHCCINIEVGTNYKLGWADEWDLSQMV